MAFQPLAHLHVRQLMNGRKSVVLIVLAVMPLFMVGIYQTGGGLLQAGSDRTLADLAFLYAVYGWATCLLTALIYGTSILHAEVEGKTISYLFTRPVPKWKVLLAKYVATVAVVALPLIASLTLGWLMLSAPGGIVGITALVLQTVVGLIAWIGVFSFVGLALPKHPIPIGILYALVMEVGFTLVPAVINYFTVGYYQRSILLASMGVTSKSLPGVVGRVIGTQPLIVALLAPLAIGAIGVACYVTTHKQFVESQAQAGA